MRGLGASDTVDYGSGDVADIVRSRFPDGIDALIDTVDRDDAFTSLADLCRPGGRVATTLGAADVASLAAREVSATNVMGSPTPEKLRALAQQVAAGTLRAEIQQTFPLSDAAAALEAFTAGKRGKIVIVV